MITQKEYLDAVKLIDDYKKQSMLDVNGINKTPINQWKYINNCSVRLRSVLTAKRLWIYPDYVPGFKFIENVTKEVVLGQRNIGKKTWHEFVELTTAQ